MTHDFTGCDDAACPICRAYVAGHNDVCSLLLHVRDNGLSNWVARCAAPCDHPRCTLLWTLDFAYRAVAAKAHSDGADAWATQHPGLAAQLRDVLDDDGATT